MKTPLCLPIVAAALFCATVSPAQELQKLPPAAQEQATPGLDVPKIPAGSAEAVNKRLDERRRVEIAKQDGEKQERLHKMKREIGELRAAGHSDEAQRLEERLRGEMGKSQGGQSDRMQHIAEAIKHLRAAGLNEPAEHIEQMVREMKKAEGGEKMALLQQKKAEGGERMIQQKKQPAPQEGMEQMQRAMKEMQEQTHRAMQEMNQQTQAQMQKLAQAIEELRQQASKK